MERTIARQRARVRYLAEGDANTKYFHILARGRRRRNLITSIQQDGVTVTAADDIARAFYDHFCGVFGRPGQLGDSIDFEQIGIFSHDLSLLDQPVTDEEVWATIKDIPSDRAPGPDGFTGAFYKSSWTVIRHDVMAAINALLFGDNRAFHRLNSALIVLLPKRADASAPADYRLITIIHSIAKLVS